MCGGWACSQTPRALVLQVSSLGLSDVRRASVWSPWKGPEHGRRTLTHAGSPSQLGQAPESTEGQPGPASEIRFFTLKNFFFFFKNFFSLSPLFSKSLFICVCISFDLQSVNISSFFFFSPRLGEVPRLGVKSEWQLLAYTTATATGSKPHL